jgi:hypothetical protein
MNLDAGEIMNPKPHDVLEELFSKDADMSAVSGLEELDTLIHACLPPKISRPTETKLLSLKRKAFSSKRKTTHYLRADVFDGLTQAKEILQRLLPDGSKSRASKSSLVNFAVNELLRDIEEKGTDSAVIKTILQKKA